MLQGVLPPETQPWKSSLNYLGSLAPDDAPMAISLCKVGLHPDLRVEMAV